MIRIVNRQYRMVLATGATLALAASALAAPNDEATLKQTEVRWGKALIAKDTKTLKTIIAADWTMQTDEPKPISRDQSLANNASGKSVITAYAVRDMRVRVMGNAAMVQGFDDETSSFDGKDTSGTYSWTDMFERRGGKWVAVATQVTKVAK